MKKITLLVCLIWAGCAPKNAQEGEEGASLVKKQQYYVEGLRLYRIFCQNCHQEDGKGLARLIPPLAGSDLLLERRAEAICGVKHGFQGKLVVNGVEYDQPMPAYEVFGDLDLAEVLTYASNAWGNEAPMVTLAEVRQALEACQPDSLAR